jgi:hypothetical protein
MSYTVSIIIIIKKIKTKNTGKLVEDLRGLIVEDRDFFLMFFIIIFYYTLHIQYSRIINTNTYIFIYYDTS